MQCDRFMYLSNKKRELRYICIDVCKKIFIEIYAVQDMQILKLRI